MRRLPLVAIVIFVATACGASPSVGPATGSAPAADAPAQDRDQGRGDSAEFQLAASDTAEQAHGERPSEIEATETHAAMRLFVVDSETGPIEGIVIKLTAPDGTIYYTGESDSHGYAEVLVPVGQRYGIEYLSLGRRNTTANVAVPEGPNQDIRLTMRYRRQRAPVEPSEAERQPRVVLEGVHFESNRTTIEADSYPRLDSVVEYMVHTPSARIRVAGHTDNLGDPRRNQALSEARAQAVRDYLVSHGVDRGRIEAVGYGDQRPIASNDTEEGRQKNRRIEAIEL
ncbi:MAG: OmpA family protein [Polyangiaceae bacterium]|nr:OmpA family protein [Polyangiaceae bacterium]